jgi:hypothetical protein
MVIATILDLETLVLKDGSHETRRADALCVMEAVAWVAGETHSDHPTCACPVIGAFLRNWNDNIQDEVTRTRLLRPLIPLLVNSKATREIELRRSYLALDWLARVQAPAWLSLRDDLKAHAVTLRGLKPLVSAEACREAQPMLVAAGAAARDAARDAAGDAARAAAGDALAPTVAMLQQSALELVRSMLREGGAQSMPSLPLDTTQPLRYTTHVATKAPQSCKDHGASQTPIQ